MTKKNPSKEQIIQDVLKIAKKYKKEFKNIGTYVTRDYYKKYGKYTENDYNSHWGNFGKLKEEVMKIEGFNEDEFKTQKKILELEQELKDIKIDNKKLLKTQINNDTLIDLYEESLKERKISLNINNSVLKRKENKYGILNLSDWHVGEIVNPEDIININEYNKDIFVKRADNVWNTFIKHCETIGIKNITINFLGDLLSGNIHHEIETNSDLNVIDALFFLNDYILTKLELSSKYFNNIKINFLPGNHGRLINSSGSKPYYKNKAKLNFEYILAKQIDATINLLQKNSGYKKIKINVSKSPFILDVVRGKVFLLHHGDTTNSSNSFSGLPYYGLCSSSAKLNGALKVSENIRYDHVIIGHFHTKAIIPLFQGGMLFINPSLIGTTEFSLSKIKSNAEVSQLMLVLNEDSDIEGIINIKG